MEVGSVLFALAFTAFAYARSFAKSGYYDGAIYGMTAATHRKYAGVGLLLGAIIWTLFLVHQEAIAMVADAVLAIVAVFYLSSFLRGAHEEQ